MVLTPRAFRIGVFLFLLAIAVGTGLVDREVNGLAFGREEIKAFTFTVARPGSYRLTILNRDFQLSTAATFDGIKLAGLRQSYAGLVEGIWKVISCTWRVLHNYGGGGIVLLDPPCWRRYGGLSGP